MTMLRLEPLPDELAQGYRGRLAKVHGWVSDKDSHENMVAWLGTQGVDGREHSVIELLAHVAGQTSEQFTQRHSMVPFRRFLTSSDAAPHGVKAQRPGLALFGMVELRPNACFCEQCVREDVKFHGISYWRRSHQLPGLFWCTKHGTPLRYVTQAKPFANMPAEHLQDAETFDPAWVDDLRSNECIDRYVTIAHELLESRLPVKFPAYEREIRKRCKEIGIVCKRGVSSTELKAYVAAQCDQRWQSSLRYRKTKIENKSGDRRKESYDTASVVLVLASLFDTADQALNQLKDSKSKQDLAPKMDADKLRAMYKLTKGNHVTMCSMLGVTRAYMRSWMAKLGLPPVGTNDHDKMLTVLQQLIRGDVSLAQACADEDLQLPYMRKRLEVALMPLMGVLKEFAETPVEKEGRWQTGQRSQERIARLREKLPAGS